MKSRGKDDIKNPHTAASTLGGRDSKPHIKNIRSGMMADSFDCSNMASHVLPGGSGIGNIGGMGRSVIYASLPAMDTIGSLSSVTAVTGTIVDKAPASQGSLVDDAGYAARASSFEAKRRDRGEVVVGRGSVGSADRLPSHGS